MVKTQLDRQDMLVLKPKGESKAGARRRDEDGDHHPQKLTTLSARPTRRSTTP
jgi:hypothetical protein